MPPCPQAGPVLQASLGEWGTEEPGPELSPTAGPSRETPLPALPLDPMSTHAGRPVPGRNSKNCQMDRWTQPIMYYVFCLYVLNLQVPIFHWLCRFLSRASLNAAPSSPLSPGADTGLSNSVLQVLFSVTFVIPSRAPATGGVLTCRPCIFFTASSAARLAYSFLILTQSMLILRR